MVLSQGLQLGVVHGEVPALRRTQLVAPAVEEGLALWGHGLQGGQHCPTAFGTPRLVQVQTTVVQVCLRTLDGEREGWDGMGGEERRGNEREGERERGRDGGRVAREEQELTGYRS